VLWVALAINAGMFLVEIAGGLISGSGSLQADALDFLGDAFNYGISLVVVSLALTWRARAALLKGITMGLFGLWVIGQTVWHVAYGSLPEPYVMGASGTLALAANAAVALMLYRFRSGDGSSCAITGCRTGSSHPITTSSTTAAGLGTISSIGPGPSCPSACAIGLMGRDHRDLV
jgi:Co/Zn/Cd efflux system component